MNELRTGHAGPVLRIPKVGDVIPAVLLVLAARTGVIGMYPFGVALFAAVFDKRAAYVGIAAVCAGVITNAGAGALPKYLIALILFWIFSGVYGKNNNAVKAVACGISLLLGGLVEMTYAYSGLYGFLMLCTESVIAAFMYIVFENATFMTENFAKREKISSVEYLTAAVTVGIIIAGVGDVTVCGISPRNVLSIYAVMVAALNAPLTAAGCAGMSIGFISAMSSETAVMFMGIYGVGALLASFMNAFGRVGCAVGFVGGMAVTMIYLGGINGMGIFDSVVAAALFCLTPNVVHEYLRSFFTKSVAVEQIKPDKRMCEYLTMRLEGASEAFASLRECFEAVSDNRLKRYDEDIGTILDETTDRVCGECAMCGKCWQTDFRRTYKNVLELIGIIEKDGMLSEENVPAPFCERCANTYEFIRELNHVYELYKRDVLRRSDAVTARDLIASQYSELCHMFSKLSEEINSGFRFMEDDEEKIVEALDRQGIIPYEVSAVESLSGFAEVYLRLPPVADRDAVEGILTALLGRPMGYEKTKGGLDRYVSKPNYTMDTAVLQTAKDGFGVNGDSVTVFVTDDNKFYAFAADGMGSGSEARYESASMLRLLTSFIKSGFTTKTALGIMNSAMCLNMDNEMYAAIDMLSVDLYTGDAQLYKVGGAKTLISCGENITTAESASAPAGILSDIRLNGKKFILSEGDTVLIMTDGITEAGYTAPYSEWIKDIMKQPHENMEALAKDVMDTALKKERGIAKDDMSVIAMRVMGV